MHVLIASGHHWAPRPNDRQARARELSAFLRERAHVATVVEAPPRARPPFRRVAAWLVDPVHERDVAVAVRGHAPDVVHLLGCAAGSSVRLAWVVRSLGVPCTMEIEAVDLLCHRGDLVHADGQACQVAGQPEQCAVCCRTHTVGRGLSRAGVLLARVAQCLGDASPFPTRLAFANRRDLLGAALADADAVVVRDQAGRDAALALGVAAHRVVTDPLPDTLLALWASLADGG